MPYFRLVEQRRGTSEFVLVQLHATMEFRELGGIVRWQKVPARFGPFVIVSLHLASVGLAQGASKRLASGSDGEETRRETSRTQPLQPPDAYGWLMPPRCQSSRGDANHQHMAQLR